MIILLLLLFPNFLLSLTMQDAICKADLNAYEMRIKEQEISIKAGEVWQASLIPNPALDIVVDSFNGSGPLRGVESSYATYQIQTLLELGGKRGQRTHAAALDKLLAEWDFEETRVQVLTKLKIAYLDAWVSQEKLVVARRFLENTKKALDLAHEYLASGRESKVNVSRMKVTYIQAAIDVEKLEQDFLLKKNALSNFWNESCPAFQCLEFNMNEIPLLCSLCTYEEILLNYPGLVRQKLLVDRANREVEVQKSYAWPDVLLSLGVDQELQRGNVGMHVELNVPLPFFNVNQGKIFSARHQSIQAELEYKHYYLDLLLQVRKIYKFLEVAFAEVQLYQQEIVPSLEENQRGAVEAFKEGKMDLIRYLDHERFFLETKNSFLETLAAFHKYYAELCQFIRGIP